MNTNLIFNALTFDLPNEPVTFHFSKTKVGNCQKIYKTKFPKNIEEIFPGIIEENPDFIYTSFIFEKDGYTPLPIDFHTENHDLIKHYYSWRINKFFKGKSKLVKTNFIKDNQVWLKDNTKRNPSFATYNKFTIKVQLKQLSNYGELIIAYDGTSRVILEPVSTLTAKVSPSDFTGIIHKLRYFRHNKLNGHIDDFSKAYAVLNNDLSKALGYEIENNSKPGENTYIPYKEKIDLFIEKFLFQEDFREVCNINHHDYLPVDQKRIGFVEEHCNELRFKNGIGRVPKYDFKKLKPFQTTPYPSIHLFFILHNSYADQARMLQTYLEKEHNWFKGLYNYAGILYHVEQGFSIVYDDLENPLPEIQQELQKKQKENKFKSDVKYVAFYLSPYSKYEPENDKRNIYYKIKELLLAHRIISQVIDYSKLREHINEFTMQLTNISLALLAKLEGIPWQLNEDTKKELVIGVGAFKNVQENINYVASTFCFNNNGKFNKFDYFSQSDTKMLAGSISDAIHQFTTIIPDPEKIVIHFYKEMSDKESKPIIEKMEMLKLECPLYIVNINKTKSKDIIAFDQNWHGKLMPKSGTYINISNDSSEYLLFNNSRYDDKDAYPGGETYAFPIKLKITSPTHGEIKDAKDIKNLIEQVYQFSRLYWKSLRQQNVPITIKYPEMVAEIAPNFNGQIPPYGKDKLWFL